MFYHFLQPCNQNIPLFAADILKMALEAMHHKNSIVNIDICRKDPHKNKKLFFCGMLLTVRLNVCGSN